MLAMAMATATVMAAVMATVMAMATTLGWASVSAGAEGCWLL